MEVSPIINIVLIIILGSIFIVGGYGGFQAVDKQMHIDCKFCSYGQDCPYTIQEFKEQEHDGGNCSDMGIYEMMWKMSFMTMGLGVCLIAVAIGCIWSLGREPKPII